MLLEDPAIRFLFNYACLRAKLIEEKLTLDETIALLGETDASAHLVFNSGSTRFSTTAPCKDMTSFLQKEFGKYDSTWFEGVHEAYGHLNTRAHYLFLAEGSIQGVFGEQVVNGNPYRNAFIRFTVQKRL